MAGRAEPFEVFFKRMYEPLLAFAMFWCGDYHDADDAVDTVMAAMCERWGEIRNPAAYARRAVPRTIIKIRRDRGDHRFVTVPPDRLPELGDLVPDVDRITGDQWVEELLGTLPPMQYAVDAAREAARSRLEGSELDRRYQRAMRRAAGDTRRPGGAGRPLEELAGIWEAATVDLAGDAEQLLCLLLPVTRLSEFRPAPPIEPQRLAAILLDHYVASGDGDTVDSYAVSAALSLATLEFVSTSGVQRPDLRERASARLTAALTGLVHGFRVTEFDADSPAGRALLATVNQQMRPERQVIAELRETLGGSGPEADLFECGWAPDLAATVAALDAIEDLLSERTRLLGLLDEEQQRLSQALQLYAERTRTYWTVVATFGTGRWPLEDVPWRSSGGESGYLTLLVASIAMKGLAYGPGLVRVGRVLTELARAGDYGPLLLQRTAELAGLVDDAYERDRLLATVDELWNRLPAEASWRETARVVRALVALASVLGWPPPRGTLLAARAADLLNEAEQLYDRELAMGSGPLRQDQLQVLGATLSRARAVLRDRPGAATALAADALRRLDALAAEREAGRTTK
ncbi:hypothetical protein OWR29_13900 [Actinoplanes sp. Pm04-4]|uniref:Uncharacterized protein n=1 Tax=Paractinoplanes pyxinae TaxID=2997416 RepID=A0ABT4AXW0_9ACTN|nr:sigma factor [Actinoplanes pyxinae]MCY1139086.1 hypothetical protein [Actinoplanes pyxinae]